MGAVKRGGFEAFDVSIPSDHRSGFIDFYLSLLLNGTIKDIHPASARILRSNNIALVRAYRHELHRQLQEHNVFDRIERLYEASNGVDPSSFTPRMSRELEKLDKTITCAKLSAEQRCRHRHLHKKWSPALINHALTEKFWRILLASRKSGRDVQHVLEPLLKVPSLLPSDLHLSTSAAKEKLKVARAHYKEAKQRSQELRNLFLEELAMVRATQGNTTAEIALKNIKKHEELKEDNSYLRSIFKPRHSNGLTMIKVPKHNPPTITSPHSPTESSISSVSTDLSSSSAAPVTDSPSSDIAPEVSTPDNPIPDMSTEWDVIVDAEDIQRRLLDNNTTHYAQASKTLFCKEPLSTEIGLTGTSSLCQDIQNGTVDYNRFPPTTQHFLKACKRDQSVPTIDSHVSIDDLRQGIKAWDERTTTSLSGVHLGHYKALVLTLSDDTDIAASELLRVNQLLLEISRIRRKPLDRWLDEVEVMLEKDPGDPKLHRLRIICLYEADYNLFLKLNFAKHMVPHAEKHNLLGQAQGGNRQDKSSNDVAQRKVLQYLYTRLTRSNFATFDNDAKSCYDRIIASLALMICMSFGVAQDACELHGLAIALMRHHVKTSLGVSDEFFRSETWRTLFGSGQGSGGSPPLWLVLSVMLFRALLTACPYRMTFTNPTRTRTFTRASNAFVDDTTNGLNDMHCNDPLSARTLTRRLQRQAQTLGGTTSLYRWETRITEMLRVCNCLAVDEWRPYNDNGG